VLVGQNDEVSYADRFAAVFKTAGKDVPVAVLPGIDHISLTLDPVAVQAAIAAVETMDHEKPNHAMQRTAGRSAITLSMIRTPLVFARRALGRGREPRKSVCHRSRDYQISVASDQF
jgi:hypothetical protein